MWNEKTNLIIAIKDHILKLYGPSSGNAFFREDGLSQIPIINSQWCQWVRHEHDELTLWFKPRIRRDPAGFISQEPIGPPAIVPLVNYPQPKGCELRVFASTEPLVLTQQNWEA